MLALVRGDDRLSEEKPRTVFEASFRAATEDEIRATFGADGGSIGPVNVDVDVIADENARGAVRFLLQTGTGGIFAESRPASTTN